ncbi:hypothetical protein J7E85_32910, partial [Paenibacillus sp. ISL-20]|nr:hypothetical protein [Paenibacillus sp. ISL-20]
MIPHFKRYLFSENGSLTWNRSWINELESPWSIFEKVKFANNASTKELFELFGNDVIKNKKSRIGKKNHNLYSLSAFDDESFKKYLGFSLKAYNKDTLDEMRPLKKS